MQDIRLSEYQSDNIADALIRNAPIGICEVDCNSGKFLKVNDSLCKILGYNHNELIDTNALDLTDDIGKEIFQERMDKILREEIAYEPVDTNFRKKDGSQIILSVNIGSLIHKDNIPYSMILIALDVTSQKIAEENQKNVIKKLYHILSNIPFGTLLVTDDNMVEFANQAFCDYFDLLESPEDLMRLSANDIIEKIRNRYTDPDKAIARIREIVRLGQVVRNEDVEMSNNKAFLRDFIPIRIGEKKLGRLWIHTDISERKRIENQLKLHELEITAMAATEFERNRLYDVLETLPAYVILLDEDYRVPFANRFFRERFGESHGKRCYEYLFNRDEPCENCETYKVMQTKKQHHWEWTGPDERNYDIYDFPFIDTDGSFMILEMGLDITASKLAEKEVLRYKNHLEEQIEERTKSLRESEKKFAMLYSSMTEGLAVHEIVYIDGHAIDYIILDVNPAFEKITGIARKDAVGKKASELYGTNIPPYLELYARVALDGNPENFETFFPPMNKHFSISIFATEKGKFATLFSDITDRKHTEEKLKQNIRIMKALSNNSRILMRATDEKSYLDKVCRIIIKDCGYKMVWIGNAEDDEEKSVKVSAYAGFDEGYIDSLKLTWSDTERGRGPTGTAIRTGKISMCNDMLTDPNFRPWREQAIKHGYASSIVFPIFEDTDKALGAISIYSKQKNAFSEDDIDLLTQLVHDITYGIKLIRTRAEKILIEDSLRESEERLSFALESSQSGAWDINLETHKAIRSLGHDKIFGYSTVLPEWSFETFLEHVVPEDRSRIESTFNKALQDQSNWNFECRIRRADGQIRWLWAAGRHRFDSNGIARHIVGIVQDITERKLAEEQNEFHSLIMETMHDAVIATDTNFLITVWNPAAEQMYGWSEKEVLGKNYNDILRDHKDEDDKIKRLFGELDTKKTVTYEAIHRRKDEMKLYIEARLTTVKDNLGKIIHYVTANRNITKRKRIENSLRESEERFKLALKNAPVSVAAQDKDLKFIWAYNQRTVNPEYVIGKTDYDLFSKEDAELLISFKRQVLESEKEIHKTLWITSNGRKVYIDLFIEPLRDANNNIIGVGVATVDLTQMKLSQEALNKSKEDWERTFDSVPDMISIIDTNYKIIAANKAMAKSLELSSDQCVGLECFKCAHKSLNPIHGCPHSLTLQDKKQHIVEVHEDNLHGDFLVSTTPLFDENGELLGSVHVARDITERKKSELALKNLINDKETLLREVHHRVKNNLQIIYSLIRMQSRRTSNKYIKNALEDSQSRIKSMALINEILYKSENISKLDISRYLNELIIYLCDAYKDSDKNIEVDVDIDDMSIGLDNAVSCGLIVNELITNSLKYAFLKKSSGKLIVRLKYRNDRAELIVADDGIGLNEDMNIDKIESLGLQLVYSLTKQLDGKLDINKEKGTQFKISFPLEKK